MLLVDTLITVAPLLSYYSQYSLMLESKSVGSFSIYLCLIMIVANTLRIFFWFTTGFANNLLVQSFFVIAIQIVLLDLCIKLGYKKKGEETQGFWRWNSLKPFIVFSVLLAVGVGIITGLFTWLGVKEYGNVLGLVSLGVEATLGFPQLMTNQRTKSVEGLSVIMVLCWFLGDFCKTIYFILENQPFQFIVSGSIQLAVDTLILIQIMAFKDSGALTIYENVKQDYEFDKNDNVEAEGI